MKIRNLKINSSPKYSDDVHIYKEIQPLTLIFFFFLIKGGITFRAALVASNFPSAFSSPSLLYFSQYCKMLFLH